MRLELDETFLLELAERLADRPAADPQPRRERDLQQPGPGRDLALHDPRPQAVQDLMPQDAPLDRAQTGFQGHPSPPASDDPGLPLELSRSVTRRESLTRDSAQS